MLPSTPQRLTEIDGLYRRIDSIRADIYSRLTPWQRVLVARHPARPTVLDYVNRLFTEFTEISGDRRFSDDHAMVAGFARYKDEPVMIVRTGDTVAARPLDFYQAVGQRLAHQGERP